MLSAILMCFRRPGTTSRPGATGTPILRLDGSYGLDVCPKTPVFVHKDDKLFYLVYAGWYLIHGSMFVDDKIWEIAERQDPLP
ncbi:hypothetical protein PHISCL_05473 [Aspergillus sclerotialis]|uniref:Uncharacterized protein n=1 Tax=Aspergillus sclerotialis TaxID=2070753 RepID=A0A3A2ZLC8_9EURO|nr:hypothetical protein PHISCL_05473 [Aspergillus sclerotialis]